jgi:hypothetical protein
MGLWGVARANTAVGVSPETFLLLLQMSSGMEKNEITPARDKKIITRTCSGDISQQLLLILLIVRGIQVMLTSICSHHQAHLPNDE